MIKTKQIGKHSKGCVAIENFKAGFWDTPWAFFKKCVYLDRVGRRHRHGHARWLVALCNCTYCNAKLLVREEDIFRAIHNQSVQPTKERRG